MSETTATSTPVDSGYAPINGLQMYYEVHGEAQGTPLILLHGAFSATGTSFGMMLPGLAQGRQVISVEMQAHGRTADIDRPMRIDSVGDDIAEFIKFMGFEQADLLGYSLGSAVMMNVARRYPELVRKLVLISASYTIAGTHPGLMEGMGELQPEMLHGSPFHDEYMSLAPRPEDFPKLVEQVKSMEANIADWTTEMLQSLEAPVLLIIGDSDIIQPEHAVEMFRVLGGGVIGDMVGLPKSRLAIIPGATHVTVVYQVAILQAIIPPFLDAPMPEAS